MFQDSWGLYEAPRPKKWMFHPPKRRSYALPACASLMALVLAFLALH